MLLSLRHRQALWRPLRPKTWGPSDLRAAVDDLLHMQLQAICPQAEANELYDSQHQNLHALYSWVASCGYYVGIARAVRKQQRHGTGICCRWLEHLTALIRSHCPESGRLCYALMRRMRPDESFFLVCRLGPECRVRAMETLEISSRRSNANVPRISLSLLLALSTLARPLRLWLRMLAVCQAQQLTNLLRLTSSLASMACTCACYVLSLLLTVCLAHLTCTTLAILSCSLVGVALKVL